MPMPDRLVIDVIDPTSIALSGEIDAHSAPTLATRFETLPSGDDDIVIDMAGVTFMDSSGLRVLIDLHQRLDGTSRRLVLRTPSQSVTRLLEVAGLADHFTIVR
jgi:anti-sigma B factor antagonist